MSEAEKFLDDFRGGEASSLRLSDQPGCHFDRLLKDVRRLRAEKNDLTVLVQAPPDPVVFWPESSPAVGMENIRSEICGFVEDEGSKKRIIGIYGMGGVGKTTLLREINNQYFHKRSGRFDHVIWVEVGKDVDTDRIQKQILNRLGYSAEKLPQDRDERTTMLCKELVQTNFLLLLDDLWEIEVRCHERCSRGRSALPESRNLLEALSSARREELR